jgi:hypothetical protein
MTLIPSRKQIVRLRNVMKGPDPCSGGPSWDLGLTFGGATARETLYPLPTTMPDWWAPLIVGLLGCNAVFGLSERTLVDGGEHHRELRRRRRIRVE